MEAKKELNNAQRKMLDEIYCEQFDKISKPILGKRAEGLQKLKQEVLKEEIAKDPVKTSLKMLNDATKYIKKHEEHYNKMGLKLSSSLPTSFSLEFQYGWKAEQHPKIQKYLEETAKIELDLANKKKEIRSRIYGMSTTYEEVDAEIREYIKGIK